MAEFIVVGFPGETTAATVLDSLKNAGQMDFNIEASAVATRDADGEVNIRTTDNQAVESGSLGAVEGALPGLLVGAIAAAPVAGMAIGAALGGLMGLASKNLHQTGIDQAFAEDVTQMLTPDSSAICFMFWDQPWDELPGEGSDMIREAGGKVLRTTLDAPDQQQLLAKLGLDQA